MARKSMSFTCKQEKVVFHLQFQCSEMLRSTIKKSMYFVKFEMITSETALLDLCSFAANFLARYVVY